MCGVVGAWTRSRLESHLREAALAALAHRGPDGSGQTLAAGGNVFLGHTRLAIIAPDDGRQPLASEDGTVHAVVNGEIYGYEGLRDDLEARGHRFVTRSDSEVIVHLYEERGLDLVSALRGEFAFILWDERHRRLVAGRDRFGVKPLRYAEHGGGLYLASEAKALFAMGVPAAWDEASFLHAIAHQYLPKDRTCFAGIKRLPPGCLLIREGHGSPRVVPYWTPTPVPDADAITAEEAAVRVREAVEEAVAVRLRADVPVAFALSGGLDSSAVVALAARRLGKAQATAEIHTFGVSFAHPPYDEREGALEVARHVGAIHHPVTVSQEDLIEVLADAVAHGEGLAINGQLPAKLLLARAVNAAGFSVLLTGEGADELFFGYPHLAADVAATLPEAEARLIRARLDAHHGASRGVMLPAGVASAEDTAIEASLAPIAEALWPASVPTFLRAKARFGLRLGALLDNEGRERLARRAPMRRLITERTKAILDGAEPVAKSAYLWTRLALAGYILETLGDGTEMAASVEGRPPLLDHHLAELALRLPTEHKIHRGVEKYVLREAVRGLLPEPTRVRPKHPFLAPPLAVHATSRTEAMVRDVLSGAALADVPFVDSAKVTAFLDGLRDADAAARQAAEPVLFTLLTASLLGQRFDLREVR